MCSLLNVSMVLIHVFSSVQPRYKDFRILFIKAVSDQASCETLLLKIKDTDRDSPVLLGYKGASYIIMAKHYIAPWDKWKAFKKGRQLLEAAIQLKSEEPELRFLRLAIQSNLPKLLNYSSSISSDRMFLKQKLPYIKDEDLREKTVALLQQSDSVFK